MDEHILSQIALDSNSLFELVDNDTFKLTLQIEVSFKLGSFDDMASEIKVSAQDQLSRAFGDFLTQCDDVLHKSDLRKECGLKVTDKVERTVDTSLGTVKFKRRYYKDENDERLYLLDAVFGVTPRMRVSKNLSAELVNNAAVESYQKAIGHTWATEISRQTVCNRVHSLKEVVADVPESRKTVDEIHAFIDEGHTRIHGEKGKKNVMVPPIALTEGIDTTNPQRHTIKDPLYLGAYNKSPSVMFDQVYAVADRKYNLNGTKTVYVHSDGGNWIKGIRDVFPNATFVMDEFHLVQRFTALKAFFYDKTIRELEQAVYEDNQDGFYELFMKSETKQFDKKRTKDLNDHLKFFLNNWRAIVNRRTLNICGSCTEPIVSHVLSGRIKGRLCWSKTGLNNVTNLAVYVANNRKVTADDIVISRNKPAEDQETEERRTKGFAKYDEYLKEATEKLYEWFKQEFLADRPVNDIDPAGGVQRFIKRISTMN